MVQYMKNKRLLIVLLCVSLLLAFWHLRSREEIMDYEQIAFNAMVEYVKADLDKDGYEPADYFYKWSDEPENDITYMNTMLNKDRQLTCVNFYATDGFSAWQGAVIINNKDLEVVDISSKHIFTSGVTPAMALSTSWREVGKMVNLLQYYEPGFFKENLGFSKLPKRVKIFF